MHMVGSTKSNGTTSGGASSEVQRRAFVNIEMDDIEAALVFRALSPETMNLSRNQVEISATPTGIILKVSAEDTNALRAALNSYLRWIQVARNVSMIKSEKVNNQ
jgi:tRNA threonylcarbamoyladenosine modification (KEOPS) complex  Pcc1 subunit